jgi:hypothetical protein
MDGLFLNEIENELAIQLDCFTRSAPHPVRTHQLVENQPIIRCSPPPRKGIEMRQRMFCRLLMNWSVEE